MTYYLILSKKIATLNQRGVKKKENPAGLAEMSDFSGVFGDQVDVVNLGEDCVLNVHFNGCEGRSYSGIETAKAGDR
jgi:hypothetical protein